MIRFSLNGQTRTVDNLNPNTTVLDYLRHHQQITDTKEGCGSGDCGACTIMVRADNDTDTDAENRFYTINACITLLSVLKDQQLFTASYLADNLHNNPKQAILHPAQQAMVDCHGSQCGFCTPGFVMSLACLYENHQHKNELSHKPSNHNATDYLQQTQGGVAIVEPLLKCYNLKLA